MVLNQGHKRLIEGSFKIVYFLEKEEIYVTDFLIHVEIPTQLKDKLRWLLTYPTRNLVPGYDHHGWNILARVSTTHSRGDSKSPRELGQSR